MEIKQSTLDDLKAIIDKQQREIRWLEVTLENYTKTTNAYIASAQNRLDSLEHPEIRK